MNLENPASVQTPESPDLQITAQQDQPVVEAQRTPSLRPAFRVFGIGNAGANVLETLIKQGFPASACVLFNSDATSLAASSAGEKLLIEGKQGRGIGSGGDPERGRTGAEARQSEIEALCKDTRGIVMISGMGGGAGTGGAPIVARLAKASGALVVSLPLMPFECEGPVRRRTAESGLGDLRNEADLVLPFCNERVVAADDQKSLLDTFKAANEIVACSTRCVYHAFASGSVMGLPFADICALMRDRSDDCILAAVEFSGADRAQVASEKLIAHPALERGASSLPEADAVALCVLGGPSLGMVEVNKIVERTAQECASSPFIMGAAIHPGLGDSLSVLLLVGRQKQTGHEPRRGTQAESHVPWAGDVSGPCTGRPKSRILPPPPEISQERAQQLHKESGGRGRKVSSRMRQAQLPLDIISRGRFDKSEPTIHKGEDLDVPTYVRRGIALN